MEISDVISFLAIFVVVWWMVFFMALPIGIEQQSRVKKGNEPGAPKNPNLKAKALGATIVSLIITALIFYGIEIGAISELYGN